MFVTLIVAVVLSGGFATFVALDDSADSKLVNTEGFSLSAGGYLKVVTALLLPMLALLFTWVALRRVVGDRPVQRKQRRRWW
jgi:hypothetical protein